MTKLIPKKSTTKIVQKERLDHCEANVHHSDNPPDSQATQGFNATVDHVIQLGDLVTDDVHRCEPADACDLMLQRLRLTLEG